MTKKQSRGEKGRKTEGIENAMHRWGLSAHMGGKESHKGPVKNFASSTSNRKERKILIFGRKGHQLRRGLRVSQLGKEKKKKTGTPKALNHKEGKKCCIFPREHPSSGK